MKWIIIILQIFLTISVIVTFENLHDFMDSHELEYYFGTNVKNSLPEYEIIHLPTIEHIAGAPDDATENEIIHFNFNAFENPISLKLQKNHKLISPFMRIVKRNGLMDQATELFRNSSLMDDASTTDCHYLHFDNEFSAALSNCYPDDINGFILLPNTTLEIRPLNQRLKSIVNLQKSIASKNTDDNNVNDRSAETLAEDDYLVNPTNNIPHLIRRGGSIPKFIFESDAIHKKLREFESSDSDADDSLDFINTISMQKRATTSKTFNNKITIEIGIFFDEAAYRIFSPLYDYDDNKLQDLILAYINGVQALYHHPSLGRSIDLTIVYIEIMQKQSHQVQHYNGEREQLLDSFCEYQKNINPPDDSNPRHWDMGLYISGLDFFAIENGRRNGATMGLATVGGVCLEQYACIIAEFGTTNTFGRPYPSAGFTSVYILAHEIGHNIGMHHDSSGNYCNSEGFIMSPSRGTQGETTWSTCSAEVVKDLSWAKCLFDKPIQVPASYNSWKYNGVPGQIWTAKQQCELLLVDKDSIPTPSNGFSSICQNLHCRTPNRSGFYFAGPALEGTDCGTGRWCEGGNCVAKRIIEKPIEVIKGGWTDWKLDKCNSGCIKNAKGSQKRHRTCDNPKPLNTDEGCEGSSFDVVLCNDDKICKRQKRISVSDYASKKCKEFSKNVPDLDTKGRGLQSTHETLRLWMGCAIFCKRYDSSIYYTPRIELNDLGISSYFPDGTWCHNDGLQDYFCVHNHCLPENFQLAKHSIWELSEDVPLPGNAPPNEYNDKFINEKLLKYLSIDQYGRPLLTKINVNDVNDLYNEDAWTDKDYLELPLKLQRKINNDNVNYD